MINLFESKALCDLELVKERLYTQQCTEWKNEILQKPKLRFYREFKNEPTIENYVSFNLLPNERSILAQIRLGILPLAVETGRFINLPLEERLCKNCNVETVEDEWHFVFDCDLYDRERTAYFDKIVNTKPEFIYLEPKDQLKYLFETKHRSFAKYLNLCFKKRKDFLFQ